MLMLKIKQDETVARRQETKTAKPELIINNKGRKHDDLTHKIDPSPRQGNQLPKKLRCIKAELITDPVVL